MESDCPSNRIRPDRLKVWDRSHTVNVLDDAVFEAELQFRA